MIFNLEFFKLYSVKPKLLKEITNLTHNLTTTLLLVKCFFLKLETAFYWLQWPLKSISAF